MQKQSIVKQFTSKGQMEIIIDGNCENSNYTSIVECVFPSSGLFFFLNCFVKVFKRVSFWGLGRAGLRFQAKLILRVKYDSCINIQTPHLNTWYISEKEGVLKRSLEGYWIMKRSWHAKKGSVWKHF